MKKNKKDWSKDIVQLEDKIKNLPVKMQSAIYWAVENFDALEEMGKNSEMTLEEIQRAKMNALAEENYATLMLLHITEYVKQSKGNKED